MPLKTMVNVGNSADEGGGLVLSGSNLVVATNAGVLLVDTKTGVASQVTGWTGAYGDYASAATTDAAGNIYFSAPSGTYALRASGQRIWEQPEGRTSSGQGTSGPNTGKVLALDPDGVLYGVSADLQVRAFRASDGVVLWRHAIGELKYPSFANQSSVLGGVGNALFVRPGSEETLVLDKRTGAELGRLALLDGSGDNAGWTTSFALGFSRTVFQGTWFFDNCGKPILSGGIPRTLTPTRTDVAFCGTLGLTERYSVYLVTVDTNYKALANSGRLSLYDANGSQVRGPTLGKGQAISAGADGTLYTLNCYISNPPENRLYAYDADLNELWHVDLESNSCSGKYGVLDDHGVLYLPIANDQAHSDDVMAIQTRSPGLARSAWPMVRHDNRGTMWLGRVDETGVDAGASGQPTTIDAGLDASIGAE